MLGNGVVPQQAEYAIHQLLNCETPFWPALIEMDLTWPVHSEG
jgi:hypothetical protein